MFQTKKKKIQTYLIKKPSEQFTSFDELLEDYLSGKMKETFSALGTKKIKIHIAANIVVKQSILYIIFYGGYLTFY